MPFLADATPRQREIYGFIRDRVRFEGRPPTLREIGRRFGIGSPNGVVCHLDALEKKGLIRLAPKLPNGKGTSRGIQLIEDTDWPAIAVRAYRIHATRFRSGVAWDDLMPTDRDAWIAAAEASSTPEIDG